MPSLNITLTRSLIGYEKSQRLTANALGLGKVGSRVTQPDTAPIRGMVQKLVHVLLVESEAGGVVSEPTERTPRKKRHGPHHGPLGVHRK